MPAMLNRQVIEKLKTRPEDETFGCMKNVDEETRTFYQELYDVLKKSFTLSSTSSRANSQQIENIKNIEISHRDRFSEYKHNKLAFWEFDVQNLRYFNKQSQTNAKAFLKSACRLNQNVNDLSIVRRFVDVATYKLYRRAFPGNGNISEAKAKELWTLVRVSNPGETEISDLCDILRRGKKERDFCTKLTEKNIDEEEDNSIYALLFVKNIPDAIWGRQGLFGKDYDKSIKKLRELWVSLDETETAEAADVAKLLLDYHAERIVWPNSMSMERGSKKRRGQFHVGAHQGKRPRAKTAKKSRSEGRPPFESASAVFEHDVLDRVLSVNAAAQILNRMTRNVDDDSGFSSDPADRSIHTAQDTRQSDRLVVSPMIGQVHSDSATIQIRNAEESNSTSARNHPINNETGPFDGLAGQIDSTASLVGELQDTQRSNIVPINLIAGQSPSTPDASQVYNAEVLNAHSAGHEERDFVGRNGSVADLTHGENTSIQQIHTSNYYVNQNILASEEEHQNQLHIVNSTGYLTGEGTSIDTHEAITQSQSLMSNLVDVETLRYRQIDTHSEGPGRSSQLSQTTNDFDLRNPQPAPNFPPDRVSNATNPGQFQPSAGGLIDPAATQWQKQQFAERTVQQFQQSETTQSFNFYDQTPLMTIPTQPSAERTVQQSQQSETTQNFNFYDQTPLMTIPTQPPAERTVQDGAQSYVPYGSQGFEEIHFDTRHLIDPHGFDAVSFDSHGNAWFTKDSQGFEQVSFDSQNRIWQTAPSQGFEFISFNENHTAMSL